MEHLLQKRKCSILNNIFKPMIFQRWFLSINPLLHRLFFYHFLFLGDIEKNQEKFKLILNSFESILENGTFAPKEEMLHSQ